MLIRSMAFVFCMSGSIAACGGHAALTGNGSGGSGGDAGSTTTSGSTGTGTGTGTPTTSSGQGGGLPPGCAVTTPEEGPYATTFRMLNNGAETVYVAFRNCSSPHTVTACADDYDESLALWKQCTVDCELSPNDCVLCDLECPDGPIAIAPGEAYEEPWSGFTYQFDLNEARCSCHREQVAPAARYRVTVPVYETEQDAWDGIESAVRVVDFELSSSHQDVVINL